MSKVLNLREGSYSHAKLSLYTVYEYVYLQVQAIPHDYARFVTERLLTPAHLPQPVQHRRALGYELSHAFPYILGCQGSRYQPCPKVFDCRCAWTCVDKKL